MLKRLSQYKDMALMVGLFLALGVVIVCFFLANGDAQQPRKDVLGATLHHNEKLKVMTVHAGNAARAESSEHLVEHMANQCIHAIGHKLPKGKSPYLIVPLTKDGNTWGFQIYYK